MNAILLRTLQPPRTPSLVAFSDYREAEQANGAKHSSVAANGALLEYETLELRVHPPNVNVDNDSYADRTLITLDSANRPGTLVEVVQLLTELGLCVIKARISSDGGWFVDEFSVTDSGKKVMNERKLRAIRKVLSVDADPGSDTEAAGDSALEEAAQSSTVFELAGNDRIGLLADVIELLKNNGCEVRSAAVWTHNLRCAFVISVLDCASGLPIKDGIKLARLRQLLLAMMDSQGESVVNVTNTKGLIHYERRLHQLLLKEEEAQWRRQTNLAAQYEQEIAEQQALQERRWAGPTAGPSAGVAGRPGAGARPQLCASALATPSMGAALPSPSSMLVTLTSPKQGTTAAAAAAAAANITVATGSPTMGSPEGSSHGGVSCLSLADGQTPSGASGPVSSSAAGGTAKPGPGLAADGTVGQSSANGGKTGVASPSASSLGASGTSNGATGGGEATPASSSSSPQNSLPAAALVAPPSPCPPMAPPASSAQKPEVWVQHTKQHNYWTVSIRCRDRQKLLFDTVCTLADLNYDVYHGAVDCEVERDKAGAKVSVAVQTFYMRPRYGDSFWDPKKAAKLRYMLECAIQRRQPQGTKVHIQGAPSGGTGGGGTADLPALTAVWRKFGLCITRAKVRALAGSAGEHTFYLVDNYGRQPADTVVQQACQQIGGVRLARPDGAAGAHNGHGAVSGSAASNDAVKFGFTVYSKPGWGGPGANLGSPSGSVADSI